MVSPDSPTPHRTDNGLEMFTLGQRSYNKNGKIWIIKGKILQIWIVWNPTYKALGAGDKINYLVLLIPQDFWIYVIPLPHVSHWNMIVSFAKNLSAPGKTHLGFAQINLGPSSFGGFKLIFVALSCGGWVNKKTLRHYTDTYTFTVIFFSLLSKKGKMGPILFGIFYLGN